MGEKEITTVNLTVENLVWLDENVSNRSELINGLIENYRHMEGSANAAAARFKQQRIQSKLQAIEEQRQSLQDELDMYRQAENAASTEYDDDLGRLLSKLEDGVRIWPEHGVVEEIAAKHSKFTGEVLEDLIDTAESAGVQTETVER